MKALFWGSLVVVLYVYLGYPALLRLLSLGRRGRAVRQADREPTVTLIISAYNEEAVIGQKLDNTLALDYAPARLEIVVVSDGSSDRTDEIVRAYGAQGVRLLRVPERRGKTFGLNEAVRRTSGEVLVFSDANALYRRDALRKLVRNFADPAVGCVTGESRYVGAEASPAGRQESAYWRYERRLKLDETRLGSMVGADGAIFAVRRALYRPLDEADINDFVTPLQVVMSGYRCVYEPAAICDEQVAIRYDQEFRRKARIVNRSAYALRKLAPLLNPFRYGWFSLELLSHKILRWLVPAWLVALLGASAALAAEGGIYRAALYGQLGFYLAAAAAGLSPRLPAPLSAVLGAARYFCVVNLAAVVGLAKALAGRVEVVWTPERSYGRPAG